jgi:membrane protease YdiL (CAAX protease family)
VPLRTRFWPAVLVFVVVTWLATLALAWWQARLGWSPFVVRLPLLAPGIAAAAVMASFRGRLAWPPVTPTRWKSRLALATEMALAIFLLVWFFVFISRQFFPKINALHLSVPLAVLIVIQLALLVVQEAGWRGTLQPLLEGRLNPFWAALITGAIWGLGRLEYAGITPTHFALQLVGTVGLSVVLAAATMGLRRRDRVIIATLVQGLITIAFLLWFGGGDISIGWLTYTTIAFVASGAACVPLLLGRAQREHERTTAFD